MSPNANIANRFIIYTTLSLNLKTCSYILEEEPYQNGYQSSPSAPESTDTPSQHTPAPGAILVLLE